MQKLLNCGDPLLGFLQLLDYINAIRFLPVLCFLNCAFSAGAEIKLIRLGMIRFMSDLNMCINFREVSESDPEFKIRITPYMSDG